MGNEGQASAAPAEATPLQKRLKKLEGECLGLHIVYNDDDSSLHEGEVVDVVAVHGIGAHPEYTWRTQNIDWLSHPNMLPKVIPCARIMRYGYRSQWFGEHTVRQRLSIIARDLLRALKYERSACKYRPLVLLGHCYGGLVIQKAAVLAKIEDHQYTGIHSSLSGVIFLGTPHRGTGSITSEGLACAVLKQNPEVRIDTTVLQSIRTGNEITTDLLHEFTTVCSSMQTPICCFFEQQPTRVGGIIEEPDLEEIVVDEASACIDGYPKHGLSVDHFRLNKFASPDDACFKAVAGEIQQMVTEAPHRVASRRGLIQNGDRFGSSASIVGVASVSLPDDKKLKAPETSQAQDTRGSPASKPPMPVKTLLKSLQSAFDAKRPSTSVKVYTSPKTGRRLLSPQFCKGDKVGFRQARIAHMCSDEWTYDPYYVCDTKVSKSDDYLHLVAADLNGYDGAWVKEKDIEYYQKSAARSWS